MKISAAIITFNAAQELDRCLASLAFLDEVVVVDQGSTDDTVEVCRRHGATLHQSEWLGFGPTKQKAVDLCRNDWVLSIDSDEEITPELRGAIEALGSAQDSAAFAFNRISRFLGKWIHHSGWHPEYVVRLFDRRQAGFNDLPVHESVVTSGKVTLLEDHLLHYTYDTMEQYLDKLNRYTSLAASHLHSEGRTTSLPSAVLRSQATFWRMWLLQRGFLDGGHGLLLAMASGFSVLTKYVKLWRLGRM